MTKSINIKKNNIDFLKLKLMLKSYSYKSFQLSLQNIDIDKLSDYFIQGIKNNNLLEIIYENSFFATLSPFSLMTESMGMLIANLDHFLINENNNLSKEKSYQKLAKKIVQSAINKNISCIIAKIPIDATNAINSLIKQKFYYVSTESIFILNLTLDKIKEKLGNDLPSSILKENKSFIREAKKEDLPETIKLSENNHNHIRYYNDPYFQSSKIKEFYSNICSNSFKNPHHKVFIYAKKDKVLGFITIIINNKFSKIMNQNYASLDYIVVDSSLQNKNIGLSLNLFAIKYLIDNAVDYISVKTMGNNYKAIRLLQKTGFILSSQSTILHWNSEN